jgi:hypothetical protein
LLFNALPQIFHAYSGQEQVKQYHTTIQK